MHAVETDLLPNTLLRLVRTDLGESYGRAHSLVLEATLDGPVPVGGLVLFREAVPLLAEDSLELLERHRRRRRSAVRRVGWDGIG